MRQRNPKLSTDNQINGKVYSMGVAKQDMHDPACNSSAMGQTMHAAVYEFLR